MAGTIGNTYNFFIILSFWIIIFLEPYHLLELAQLIPDGVIAIEASGRATRLGMVTLEVTAQSPATEIGG